MWTRCRRTSKLAPLAIQGWHMNRAHQLKAVLFLLVIFLAVPAFASSQSSAPWKLPATFSGTLPCADCPGIEVTLTLRADGTYYEHFKYVDRNSQYAETGKWAVQNDGKRLVLHGEKNAVEQWTVAGTDELRKLDADGKEIDSKLNFTLKRVPPSGSKLRGTEWRLEEMNGHAVDAKALNQPISIEFDEEEPRFFSSSGCNRLNGGFTLSGSELKIKPGPMTMMACPEPAMTLEQDFVKMLGAVETFKIEGNGLTLSSKGKTVGRFVNGE